MCSIMWRVGWWTRKIQMMNEIYILNFYEGYFPIIIPKLWTLKTLSPWIRKIDPATWTSPPALNSCSEKKRRKKSGKWERKFGVEWGLASNPKSKMLDRGIAPAITVPRAQLRWNPKSRKISIQGWTFWKNHFRNHNPWPTEAPKAWSFKNDAMRANWAENTAHRQF